MRSAFARPSAPPHAVARSGASGVTPATWNSADPAGRSGGRAERLQPVLGREALQAVDDADGRAQRQSIPGAEHGPEDLRAPQRGGKAGRVDDDGGAAVFRPVQAVVGRAGRRRRRRCRGNRRSGWCARPARSCRTRRRSNSPQATSVPARGGGRPGRARRSRWRRSPSPRRPASCAWPCRAVRRPAARRAAHQIERADIEAWSGRRPSRRLPPAFRRTACPNRRGRARRRYGRRRPGSGAARPSGARPRRRFASPSPRRRRALRLPTPVRPP